MSGSHVTIAATHRTKSSIDLGSVIGLFAKSTAAHHNDSLPCQVLGGEDLKLVPDRVPNEINFNVMVAKWQSDA